MSYTTTYSDLVSELQIYTEDDSTEYQGELSNIINRSELRVARDLNLELFTSAEAEAMSSGVATDTPTIPSNGIKLISIILTATGEAVVERTSEFCSMQGAGQGQPKYYAKKDLTTLQFAPIPDASYAYEARWRTRPATLVLTTNETNWITDNAADLLLLRALVESERFLIDLTRVGEFKEEYTATLNSALMELRGMSSNEYTPTRAASKPSIKPGE